MPAKSIVPAAADHDALGPLGEEEGLVGQYYNYYYYNYYYYYYYYHIIPAADDYDALGPLGEEEGLVGRDGELRPRDVGLELAGNNINKCK